MNDRSCQALRVYSTIPHQGAGEEWIDVGFAYAHRDGKGFDVVLQALPLPLNSRLVLRDADQRQERASDLSKLDDVCEPYKRSPLKDQLEAFEREVIEQCLKETGGNIGVAMQRLSIPRRTLSDKMERLGIDRRRFTKPK
jgi:DNA-binding NtrC family response regulator